MKIRTSPYWGGVRILFSNYCFFFRGTLPYGSYDGSYLGFIALHAGILITTRRTHIHAIGAILHSTAHTATCRGVYLHSSRSIEYMRSVGTPYTTPGHDDDAPVRGLYKLGQQGYSLLGRCRQSRGKDAMTAQADNILEGFKRIATHIEGSVKGYTHIAGGTHKSAARSDIHIALRRKCAYHHAIGTTLTSGYYVLFHRGYLGLVI